MINVPRRPSFAFSLAKNIEAPPWRGFLLWKMDNSVIFNFDRRSAWAERSTLKLMPTGPKLREGN